MSDYVITHARTVQRGATAFTVVDGTGRYLTVVVPAQAALHGHADAVIRHVLDTRRPRPTFRP